MVDEFSKQENALVKNNTQNNLETEHEIDGLIQENLDLRNRLNKFAQKERELAINLRRSFDRCEKLEQTLKENREIYLLAIEATNLGIYDTEVSNKEFKLKENWLTRLGYDPSLVSDEDRFWELLIHPDDHDRVMAAFQRERKGEINTAILEYRLRAKNGDYRWIIESSKTIGTCKENGKLRIVGTHYDITERKLAEEAVREQKTFTDALIASTTVFNSTLDLNKLINLILINVGKVIPGDDADIWLLDNDHKNVHPALRKDMDGRVLSTSSVIIPVKEIAIFQEVSKNRAPVYMPEIQPDSFPIPSRNTNSRSCICAPVIFGTYFLGFLVLNSSKKNFYSATHIQRAQAFANQAAVAIRNAQLYSQAQEGAALEERQRLARDMHDVISQTLFSATIKAEALPYLMDSEPPAEIKKNLQELHRLTRGALAEMRTMLMELRPNTIANTDLGNLLNQMVEGLAGRTTAQIQLSTEGVGLLPPEVQTAIFRITQESINNILKHSKADRVQINFSNKRDRASLSIEDNGCGFTPSNVAEERMGLRIMRERADSVNASFELISQPGKGTKIVLNWKKTNDVVIF